MFFLRCPGVLFRAENETVENVYTELTYFARRCRRVIVSVRAPRDLVLWIPTLAGVEGHPYASERAEQDHGRRLLWNGRVPWELAKRLRRRIYVLYRMKNTEEKKRTKKT